MIVNTNPLPCYKDPGLLLLILLWYKNLSLLYASIMVRIKSQPTVLHAYEISAYCYYCI